MTDPVPATEVLPLASLKRYLDASGWSRRSLASGSVLFVFLKDTDIELILPGTTAARDTAARIEDALETLSALERRKRDEVIAAIRAIGYDLVRSTLPDYVIRHDTVSLGAAEEFITRMTGILAATAHAELHSNPYYERVSSLATAYANECRFGHTFRGSFGFTVESPVGPNSQGSGELPAAPPLQRRAMLRLSRGLRVAEQAISADDPHLIVDGYARGLNANACEDLASLVAAPHVAQVTFAITFSPEWQVPEDARSTGGVAISGTRGAEVLREAAKRLRLVNFEKRRTVVGRVRTLHSKEDSPADLFAVSGLQTIVVEWDSPDLGKKSVRVSLGPEDYLLAVEAHRAGHVVSVDGELEQGPWRLENAHGFKIEAR